MTPKEFFSSTPNELHLKAEGYFEAMKRDAELSAYVTSVGVNNVLNKKKIKLWDQDGSKTSQSSLERRETDLKYLKEKFGG